MHIRFDERGREILSDVPAAFNVPVQKRISTLDFHRQRLLEERQRLQEMLQAMREDSEVETFAEANDFNVEDPLDETAAYTDFELDDDNSDGINALAEKEYQRLMAEAPKSDSKNITKNDSE